jgi:hypothetical protein
MFTRAGKALEVNGVLLFRLFVTDKYLPKNMESLRI